MRLDEYIVQKKYFSSRTKANRFIREYGIRINGKYVNKPSYRVRMSDIIEINHEAILKYEKPLGYHKIKVIANKSEFPPINTNDICLDIGASAGGFSLFMLKQGARKVLAVEISHEFEHNLKQIVEKWPNFSYLIANFFDLRKTDFSNTFSLITVDLTLDPNYLIKNLHLFPQLLQSSMKPVRILFTIKTGKINDLIDLKTSFEKKILVLFPEFSYNWLRSTEDKKEIFLLLIRQ
ncbi:MAG: S4 domain-containing protein [Candidatus Hodarchaeota archaeon]